MRAERMIAALLVMQARGRVTAAELATELEVSVATARRDLEALSTAGVPVYPQPGRGGGWSLVGGARTDLSGLTASESEALFLLLGSAGSGSAETRSAVRKLLRALPGTFQADAEAAAEAIRIDPAGWGEEDRERPPRVDAVQRAVVDRTKIIIDYANRTGRQSTVTLSPLGLIAKDDLWYLLALPDDRRPDDHESERSIRTYRMDRVASVRIVDEPAERPDDFDLVAEWRRVSDYVEQRRSLVTATVQVESRHVALLRSAFGRYFEADDHDHPLRDDDQVRVTVAAHTVRAVAEQLAGWIQVADVIEPQSVRDELARIGAELTRRYADAAAAPAGSS